MAALFVWSLSSLCMYRHLRQMKYSVYGGGGIETAWERWNRNCMGGGGIETVWGRWNRNCMGEVE